MIIQFAKTYGWTLAGIACSGIFVLGVLKFFKVFDKINKDKRKYLYAAISSGLSILASGIYLWVIGGFNWGGFGVISGTIYALNQTMYAVYETIGIRSGLRKLGNLFIHFIAGQEIEKAKTEIIDDITQENKNA
jgi:hypothetical protein